MIGYMESLAPALIAPVVVPAGVWGVSGVFPWVPCLHPTSEATRS